MNCFVINLDRDAERMKSVDMQLGVLGIPYERVPAIYGTSLSRAELGALCDQEESILRNGKKLSLGEIGCAASHIQIYKKILADNISVALILEDDVNLSPDFKKILKIIVLKKSSNKSWEYLSFDYAAYGFPFLRIWFPGIYTIYQTKNAFQKIIFSTMSFCKFIIIVPVLIYEEIQKNIFKNMAITPVRSMYFTGCYLITKSGAEKLLQIGDKILYPSDKLPNIARKKKGLRFKIYTPLVVRQLTDTFASNIGNKK